MEQGIKRFLRQLKDYGLTRQQIKTLRGQALAGDIDGAIKGLQNILIRRINGSEYADSNNRKRAGTKNLLPDAVEGCRTVIGTD